MKTDKLDYARAMGVTEKREMLLNAVHLRYGDPPVFLDTTQVIAGYSMASSMSGGVYGYPGAAVSNYLFGSGSVTLSDNPTVTYQPMNGKQYAENVIRPLPPATVMPLILNGAPIDTLMRLTVQSVDGLSNVRNLGGPPTSGSVRFSRLLFNLRELQKGQALTVRVTSIPGSSKGAPPEEHVYLVFLPTDDPNLSSYQDEVRMMLNLTPKLQVAEMVYAPYTNQHDQIALVTRSMFSILSQVGSEIEVPQKNIDTHRTAPTVSDKGADNRPQIVIHSGRSEPDADEIYVSVKYRNVWYWIDDTDFASKAAFTLLQVLGALAATSHSGGAVVTIPTNG